MYSESVFRLNSAYFNYYSNPVANGSSTSYQSPQPLVGLGIELQMHVLQSVKPDAVFQIRRSEDKPYMDIIDKHYVNDFIYRHPPLNPVCITFNLV